MLPEVRLILEGKLLCAGIPLAAVTGSSFDEKLEFVYECQVKPFISLCSKNVFLFFWSLVWCSKYQDHIWSCRKSLATTMYMEFGGPPLVASNEATSKMRKHVFSIIVMSSPMAARRAASQTRCDTDLITRTSSHVQPMNEHTIQSRMHLALGSCANVRQAMGCRLIERVRSIMLWKEWMQSHI